jgi:hypothetical protein
MRVEQKQNRSQRGARNAGRPSRITLALHPGYESTGTNSASIGMARAMKLCSTM